MKLQPSAQRSAYPLALSIPSTGRTGMKHARSAHLADLLPGAFNTLNGSYRDEAIDQDEPRRARADLSIPSTGRTGMKHPGAVGASKIQRLSIPSTGRTGMKHRAPARTIGPSPLSIPSTGRTGMKLATCRAINFSILSFQYPQRVVPG